MLWNKIAWNGKKLKTLKLNGPYEPCELLVCERKRSVRVMSYYLQYF